MFASVEETLDAILGQLGRIADAEEARNRMLEEERNERRKAWADERASMDARWQTLTSPPQPEQQG